MKQENTWGGARPGSGRKPADPKDKRVQMVITIDRETRDKLKEGEIKDIEIEED